MVRFVSVKYLVLLAVAYPPLNLDKAKDLTSSNCGHDP
jgi:hypothetical protein